MLMVGNHSGGNMTPDTFIFTLAFSTYFGVERALPPARPQPRPGVAVRPACCAAAGPSPRRRERPHGARVRAPQCSSIPGGDWEVHRPTLAIATRSTSPAGRGSSGWRSTPTCRSSRWSRSAARRRRSSSAAAPGSPQLLGSTDCSASRSCRSRSPLPWGLNIGDFFGHIPLPAKMTIEVLRRSTCASSSAPSPDLDEVYDYVTRVMQETLDALAAERRFPVIG